MNNTASSTAPPTTTNGGGEKGKSRQFRYNRKVDENERPHPNRNRRNNNRGRKPAASITPSTSTPAASSATSSTSAPVISSSAVAPAQKDEASGSESDEGGEICIICCEPIKVFAVGVCNHRDVCSMCTLRLRELYKENDCCICKTPLKSVIFTEDGETDYDQFSLKSLMHDSKLNIYFDTEGHCKNVQKLWDYACGICHQADFKSLKHLRKHVNETHDRVFCDLCLSERKVFLSEQELYAPRDIPKHMAEWDGGAGAEQAQRGHPFCEFCNLWYYGVDQIYEHLMKNHFTCHICDRNGIRYQYFKDYLNLEKHFRKAHFLCNDEGCLERKFVVFSTAIDLKGHQVTAHLGQQKMSQAQKGQASRLEVNFTIRRDDDEFRDYSRARNRERGSKHDGKFREIDESADVQLAKAISESEMNQSSSSSSTTITSTTPSTPTSGSKAPKLFSPGFVPSEAQELSATQREAIEERNKRLIRSIKDALAATHPSPQHAFDEFKRLSGDFRNDKLTASRYYKQFMETFGDETGIALFPDLIDLLPDLHKREALVRVHEQTQRLNQLYPKLVSKPKSKEQKKKKQQMQLGVQNGGTGFSWDARSKPPPSAPSASAPSAKASSSSRPSSSTPTATTSVVNDFPSLPISSRPPGFARLPAAKKNTNLSDWDFPLLQQDVRRNDTRDAIDEPPQRQDKKGKKNKKQVLLRFG